MAPLHFLKDTIRIEWALGNSCNASCSYCPSELRQGSNPFPAIEKLIPAFDHLVDQCRDFSQIQVEVTGGEPTQSIALQQLIDNVKDSRVKFKLISNGSAHLYWWKSAVRNLYGVKLTYHLKEDFNHFKSVVEELHDKVNLEVAVAIEPEHWFPGIDAYNVFKTINPNTHVQLLYSNFTKGNSKYLDYSEIQWYEYYKTQGIDISNRQQVESTIEFKKVNNLNNYYGHLCWAGCTQIVIDNFGDVFRGWCKAGNVLGNIYRGDLILEASPTVCPKRQCKNGFDLQARKSENSWGIA